MIITSCCLLKNVIPKLITIHLLLKESPWLVDVSQIFRLIMSCRDLISSFLPWPKSSHWKRKQDLTETWLNRGKNARLQFPPICICRSHVSVCSSALLVSSGRVCLALKVCWDVDSSLQVDSVLRKQRLVTILALN